MKLVLLPGLDGTGVLFRPFLAALPASVQPIVVRYPPHERLGYDELMSLVREKLPRDEPFALLGESFGGPLALRIASERPPGLTALILCGSFITCPYTVPLWTAYGVTSLPFRTFPLYARSKSWVGATTAEELSLSLEALSQVAPHVFAHRLREVIRVNVAADLAACDVPMLYVQGEYDWVVPAWNVRRIVRLKPGIEIAKLPAAHMILKTQPALASAAICKFLRLEGHET
jgi:pimeloyl-ACP methyl ester carboxylesterase